MVGRHAEIQRVFDAIASALGESFSQKTVIALIELWRGKPIRIETDRLPVAMSGYCLGLYDVDLICTRHGLDSLLTQFVELHELAHLILGHVPLLSDGESTPTYGVFLQRRRRQSAHYRSPTTYDSDQEHDAETLATLLFNHLQQQETAIPDIARCLHG